METAIKTFIEVLICVAIIVALYHEDKFIKFEKDCVSIFKACKHNHIGFMDFVRIVISAYQAELSERKAKKAKAKQITVIDKSFPILHPNCRHSLYPYFIKVDTYQNHEVR